jgi:dTDP-4-dehydrorhamnose reductase
MKIAVIGNLGMLGTDLKACLEGAGHEVRGFDLPEMDITRKGQVESGLASEEVDLVINCAAYTAVDKAEEEVQLAFAINREGTANLAAACVSLAIPLIHISTDYVFDGTASKPYREDDKANPTGVYGRSKWEGEEAVRWSMNQYIIVRTAWLFGVHGPNFVRTMLRLAREREEIRVVNDQYGCPTWAADLARALVAITGHMDKKGREVPWGTYHFCGRGHTSWHGFAEAIVEEGRRRETFRVAGVTPISTEEYPTAAQRPKWSVLDTKKIKEAFGIEPLSWRQGLRGMLDALYGS